jgi:hypothetical protein
MKEHVESTKLEFLMTVNDNFIVQRFFNVREFNPSAKNSLELHEFIREFSETVQDELKTKTCDYMLENINEIMENPEILETSITDGPEFFNVYIKQNDSVKYHMQFNAKIYPPKVRYTVDVRPHIKNLLSELTDIFSSKNLTLEYLGLPLSV